MIKSEIGMNAGIIWQYLDVQGECSTRELQKLLKLNDKEYYMAMGWLARENKIVFYEKEGVEFVFLFF